MAAPTFLVEPSLSLGVQCGSSYRTDVPPRLAPVGETEFASDIARRALAGGATTRVCAGIVGYADLREEAVEGVLLAHLAVDARRFKGIRQATAWDADPRLVNPLMKTSRKLQLAREMRPWIEPCIEAFAPQRCMFESNFPVDRHSFRYKLCWNAFKRIAQNCSDDERALLFHDTAARVYRLSAGASTA